MKLQRYAMLVLPLVLAACSTFSISNQWKDPNWPGPPASNVLVLGITKSDTTRRIFEDTFTQQLEAAGVRAVQSYTQIPSGGASAKLGDVIKSSGADAILATRVQRIEQKTTVTPSGPGWGGFYGWYGGAWASTPDVNQYDEVTLETTVWDARTQKVIWTVTTQSIGTSNIPKAVQQLASTLIPKLKSDGVIR
ncbi:hypothetical protein DVT68_01125 [Dyella solisilvae]|uniref:DUF4136 domain-containing protein n=1 Tax=Dyella solisilvae TaxID=1920168 RepID=A0A370KA17_9GAMM|nr:hypothetical protein [Dyella solisilvae]RDI99493.1 hypothetical protein DVT68_01125 [Dyella solisilvae]